MSIFATYFDQAMSSSEEEREAVQGVKVSRRKKRLLPRCIEYLANPILPSLVREEFVEKLRTTRKWLESENVHQAFLKGAETVLAKAEERFQEEQERIRKAKEQPLVGSFEISSGDSDEEIREEPAEQIEWRKPRRVRDKCPRASVFPERQRRENSRPPSSNGRHLEGISPNSLSSPSSSNSPSSQNSLPVFTSDRSQIGQAVPISARYHQFVPTPPLYQNHPPYHDPGLLRPDVRYPGVAGPSNVHAMMSPGAQPMNNQRPFFDHNVRPQVNYNQQQLPGIQQNAGFSTNSPFASFVPPNYGAECQQNYEQQNYGHQQRPDGSRHPVPHRPQNFRGPRGMQNRFNAENSNFNRNAPFNQRYIAPSYREHREMMRANSSNGNQAPNNSSAASEHHSFAKKPRIAHAPSAAASNGHNGQLTSAASNRVQNSEQSAASQSSLRNRSKSIGHAPKKPPNGQQSQPNKVTVNRRKSTDQTGRSSTMQSSTTQGSSSQSVILPAKRQSTSTRAKAPLSSTQKSTENKVSNGKSPEKRANGHAAEPEPMECSPAKITKRRVPVETNEPETGMNFDNGAASSSVLEEESGNRENQPAATVAHQNIASTQRNDVQPQEFFVGNIKQEPELELSNSQTDLGLENVPMKAEVKEENISHSPDHTDAETDDSGADTEDESKNAEQAIDEFNNFVDNPEFLEAVAQSNINSHPSTTAVAANGVDLSCVKTEEPPISREEEMRQDQLENSRRFRLIDINQLLATTSQVNDNSWPRFIPLPSPAYDESDSDTEQVIRPYDPNEPPPDMTDVE